jgi:hypothetical protein
VDKISWRQDSKFKAAVGRLIGFHKLATWRGYSPAPSSDFRSGEKIFHGPRRVLGFGGFIYQKPDTRLSTHPEAKNNEIS